MSCSDQNNMETKEGPPLPSSSPTTTTTTTLLVFGSCGLDRLLTVPCYPKAEMKVRTTEFHEVGGGNAANVAHTAALLLQQQQQQQASSSSSSPDTRCGSTEDEQQQQLCCRVQLGTKIGSDSVGETIVQELQQAGVDMTGELFQIAPATTTSFTTIIVSASEYTRTCLHTPGTCGEWSLPEIQERLSRSKTTLFPWKEVCHFHSDARHTDAALYLACQAKEQQIPISLDVEKDRKSAALDELLVLADIIFTNASQIGEYLQRLTREFESELHQAHSEPGGDLQTQNFSLADPIIVNRCSKRLLSASLVDLFVQALRPHTYFTRRYQQVGKQVVITKGDQGSIHVQCDSIDVTTLDDDDEQQGQQQQQKSDEHSITLEDGDKECNSSADSKSISIRLVQQFRDHNSVAAASKWRRFRAIYTLHAIGILPDVPIVDTTGAGDAFLGGYLAAQLDSLRYPRVVDRLRLATWVAGQKIQGPGARTTLPTASQRDARLGCHEPSKVLVDLIGTFGNA